MSVGATTTEPKYARLVRGELCVWESGTVISRHKIVASADTTNGRGLTIAGADRAKPMTGVTIRDCMIQGDGDDALSIWGNVRRVTIERTRVIGLHQWPDATDFSRVNKCFTAGADPDWPDPAYPDWFTVRDSTFGGGFRCPHIRGGTFRFERCSFGPSRRNELIRPRGDFVGCEFTVQVGMKVQGGPNPWADSQARFVRPLLLTEPKPDSLYFEACSIRVIDATGAVIRSGPASGAELCRLNVGGSLVGADADVPLSTFRRTPNS